MSAEFRQLAIKGHSGRAERLFRAAISAYCSLVRPTRREAAQLDDLALPLYASVPPVARRFAAAALSECRRAPPGLIRRLSDEPVEISAALLVRSPAIGDVDLIALIGRRGLPHARVIARRPNLNPVIADLLDALKDPEIRRLRSGRPRTAPSAGVAQAAAPGHGPDETPAETARRHLRGMMRPAGSSAAAAGAGAIFRRLCETALSGHPPLFHTALADSLAVDFETARRLTAGGSYAAFCAALHRLGLNGEQAFLLAAALFPAAAGGVEAVRLFLHRYRLLDERRAAAASPADLPGLGPEPIRRAS